MDTTVQGPQALAAPRQGGFRGWWSSKTMKRFRRNPLAITGAVIIFAFILMAIFAPQLTVPGRSCARDLGLSRSTMSDIRNPVKPVFWKAMFATPGSCYIMPRVSYSPIPEPPSEDAILGTTGGGFDIYYGLIWGARIAFYVGVLVVGASLIIGIILGSIAGYFGGWVDTLIMRFVDIIFSLPSLVLAIVVVSVLGQSLTNIMIAIAAVSWASYARILRGDILQIKEQEYVAGAKALGARGPRVIFRHVLPNSIGPLIIIASLDIGAIVLVAATLSFLGLGPEIGFTAWGQMINFARGWLLGPPGDPFAYWYVSFWPGLVIILFVLGWNLLGDAFRDVLDVRS
ncbi:MAG TPA: ABC transporter permease [Trueperaceae bacterium]